MIEMALRTFPPGISRETLTQLMEDTQNREVLLQGIIKRFEQQYTCTLKALETRLAQGEGPEHPDWEDSIEWRNAVETLQRTQLIKSLLEWILNLNVPSSIS